MRERRGSSAFACTFQPCCCCWALSSPLVLWSLSIGHQPLELVPPARCPRLLQAAATVGPGALGRRPRPEVWSWSGAQFEPGPAQWNTAIDPTQHSVLLNVSCLKFKAPSDFVWSWPSGDSFLSLWFVCDYSLKSHPSSLVSWSRPSLNPHWSLLV